MSYKKLTIREFEKALSDVSSKHNKNNNFTIITGSKGAKLFNLAVLHQVKPMSEDLYELKCLTITLDAYIHPEWNYLKYPIVSLRVDYSMQRTNEIFEEVDVDWYGNESYVYVGRNETI